MAGRKTKTKKIKRKKIKLASTVAVPATPAPAKQVHIDLNKITSTADIIVSEKLVDQIVGQEKAVNIIKKAATQKRNVLLVGYPGTGKSLIAQAMSELLPVQELQDVLVYPNPVEENNPKIVVVKAGEGRKLIEKERAGKQFSAWNVNLVYVFFIFIAAFFLLSFGRSQLGDVITAAMLIGLFVVGGIVMLGAQLMRGRFMQETDGMKLLIDNSEKKKAPFVEATGARAGALLGDIRHDPYQSLLNNNNIFIMSGGKEKEMTFEKVWNVYAKKYPNLIERREDGYEAIVLPKKEKLFTLGYKNGKLVKTRIYVINRRPYSGKVIEITAGKRQVVTTPEHAFILQKKDKQARELKKGDELQVLN